MSFKKIILLVITFHSLTAFSQGFLKKFKNAVRETIDEVISDEEISKKEISTNSLLGGERLKQLKKDTSNYNYIFSQGNRASFFFNRDSEESLFLTVAKNYEDGNIEKTKLTTYEEVFDLNRTGEQTIYINQKLAYYSFIAALTKITNASESQYTTLDSAFNISKLVKMDELNTPEKYALGKTVANLAILAHAEGKYLLAQSMLEECLKYFSEEIGEETIALASLYNNYAVAAQSQGKYVDAERFFNKSDEMLTKNGKEKSLARAIVTNNRALFYNEIGQYDKAYDLIGKAENMASGELREKGRDNISFKINKGLILYSKGEYEQAETTFDEILTLKRKRMARNQTDYANVENYLASVLIAQNKPEKVEELLQDALSIFKKKYDDSHPAYLKTKHNLAKFYISQARYGDANTKLQEVLSAYSTTFGETHPSYLGAMEDLAVVDWKQGKPDEATAKFNQVIKQHLEGTETFFGAMSEHEKGKYWAKVQPSIYKFYAFAVDNALKKPELLTKMYDLRLKTKGILLNSSTKLRNEILNGDNQKLKEDYTEWIKLKEELLLYYSYTKKQLQEQNINLEKLEQQANQLEKQLNQNSVAFAQANKLPSTSIDDIKKKIPAKAAVVEIIRYPAFDGTFLPETNYAILIMKSTNSQPQLVSIKKGNELETKYAKAYRNMVKMKVKDQITYQKFWKAIDEKLQGITKVFLSPDGVYYQINISALKKPNNKYVADAMDITLFNSTRDIAKSKPSTKKGIMTNAILFGYPNFGNKGTIQKLPGTKIEVANLTKIIKSNGILTNTYISNEASEEQFKKIHSPSLLHIATHGFFLPPSAKKDGNIFGVDVNQANENPLLRSGIMLANAESSMETQNQTTEVTPSDNGIMTAYEVMNLDLQNTEIVVLSACETGLGEIKSGEGVYGLQRAFQLAGTRSIVMSLWKVSDEATQQLMTSFYQNWSKGITKEAAFAKAQKGLREKFPEPYYWGAFVMMN